ncbi:MAG: hypothetical protein EXR92_00115 [Gemmatimonadetes bacterium]|nr:hypothetical protein [Gemmatimonadota bacterium]
MDSPSVSESLLIRLRASRVRLVLRRSLEGLVWAALASLSVFGFLELGRYLNPVLPWLSFLSAEGASAVALGVLAVGLITTWIRVRRTTPDLLTIARRADVRFELDERLSTALEFGMAGPAREDVSPVLLALFQDVAEHADQVHPRVLVPLSMPRPTWYLMTVGAAVLAFELTAPLSRSATAAAPLSMTPGIEAPQGTPEAVLDAEVLIPSEGERTGDPSVRDRGEAGSAPSDPLGATLALDDFEATAARLVERQPEQRQRLPTSEEIGEAQSERVRRLIAGIRESEREREAMAEIMVVDPDDGAYNPPEPSWTESLLATALERERGRLMMDDDVLRISLGSSSGSDSGGEARPGGASPPLTGSQVDDLPSEVSPSQAFDLGSGQGSRPGVQVEAPPEERFTVVRATQIPEGAWRRFPEDSRTSDFLGLSYRGVASRYFLSLTQQPNEVERP